MAVTYTGHMTMSYMDYIDAATGKTLTCVPGQSYDIVPASGRNVPAIPPDGRFAQEEKQPGITPGSRARSGVPEQTAAESGTGER